MKISADERKGDGVKVGLFELCWMLIIVLFAQELHLFVVSVIAIIRS